MSKELLTNSRSDCLYTCFKKHFWEYELGFRSEFDSEALVFGDAFHWGLEQHSAKAGVARYCERKGNIPDEKRDTFELTKIMLKLLLEAYFWRWGDQDRNDIIVCREQEFGIALKNPETGHPSTKFSHGGKIDGILELSDKRVAIIEHKTTSFSLDVDSPYWKKLRMDKQISGYFIAAKNLGYKPETIIYDVSKKASLSRKVLTQKATTEFIEQKEYFGVKFPHVAVVNPVEIDGYKSAILDVNDDMAEVIPGKRGFAIKETNDMYQARLWDELTNTETKSYEKYFQRKEIPRLEGDIADFNQDQWNTVQILNLCKLKAFWPKNTSACFGKYGTCPYYDLCVANFDGKSTPEGFVKLENVHPELSGD